MEKNEIVQLIMNSIQSIGVEIQNINFEEADLMGVLEDSIQFISLIVSLEEELQIEIPDEYLLTDNFHSIGGLGEMLLELVQVKEN